MLSKSQVTCWIVTDGKAGMEQQCIGLTEALGIKPTVKRIRLKAPWRQLIPFFRGGLERAFSVQGDAVEPPWPDLLIGTGRQSIAASLFVKKASQGKTYTVHIQDPKIDPSHFDLVIVPRHDKLRGKNVFVMRGSLHRITPEVLQSGVGDVQSRVASLRPPYIAVLIGGKNAVYDFTPREMSALVSDLKKVLATTGGSLMITPSRRTGEANLALLREGLKDSPCYIWDGAGKNPYFGMLGLADVILVTADSVNMTTEACATGKPVYVIDLPGGSAKFRRFHESMQKDGYTRPFKGVIESWSYEPLREMEAVAAHVRKMMAR